MEIPAIEPRVKLHAAKSSLKPGPFNVDNLAISKPKMIVVFREPAAGFIELEELKEKKESQKY